MVRRGFVPYGPAGAGVEALSRVMAADLAGSSVTVNILLPGGAHPDRDGPRRGVPPRSRAGLLDPAVMGPPIVWLASARPPACTTERIVATEFDALDAGRGRLHPRCRNQPPHSSSRKTTTSRPPVVTTSQ